jgi:transposase-like protein
MLPLRHRINLRITDLIERSFVEERRRTKVIPRFTDEKSVMNLNSRRSSEHRNGCAACRPTTSNASS